MTTRPLRVLITTLALALVAPALVFAHAVVFPRNSTPGAYERYTLRVPNEKQVPTTRIELRFPADLRVTAFGDVAGWRLEVLTDSTKRIVGAVWTGSLPPQRFVELPFIAANPRASTRLVWPTYQTYADSERVEWTGVEGSKTPASVTTIEAARSTTASTAWVSWAALAIALASVALALRRDSTRPAV